MSQPLLQAGKTGSGKSASSMASVRSQRLAAAIEEAKHPKGAAKTKHTLATASAATTGYRGAANGGTSIRLSSVAGSGAGRLARTETKESREAIMKEGHGSRLTKDQIKDGILRAHTRGLDPSRSGIRLITSRRGYAIDEEAWRTPAVGSKPREFTVPCGAHPNLAFYDKMKEQELAEALANR
jgi:hypothetical protein